MKKLIKQAGEVKQQIELLDMQLEEKVGAVSAIEDLSSNGKMRRFIIGTLGSPISGAIYLDPSQAWPKAILVGLQLGKKKEEKEVQADV